MLMAAMLLRLFYRASSDPSCCSNALQGLRPRTPGILRLLAAGMTGRYTAGAAAEDTALLGSNRSAAAAAIRHERRPQGCRSFAALAALPAAAKRQIPRGSGDRVP